MPVTLDHVNAGMPLLPRERQRTEALDLRPPAPLVRRVGVANRLRQAGGRDIWSVVAYKVPGIVMGSPDVGGNQGGLQRSMSVRGTPNNQNTQMINGVNVGDPVRGLLLRPELVRGHPDLTRDPNLRRPYRNEYTAGIDHELIRDLRLSLTYIRVQERDNITNVELNVPFEAYTPITVREQGRDGVFGTADDRDITVYNENLPLQTHVTQQRNDSRVAQRADVVEVTATKRFSHRWMLLGGYTWSRAEVERTSVVNPNAALVNAAGRSGGREHQVKVTGSYELPWGLMLGGNFRLESGPFITRSVQITGLNQGTVTVNAEPRGSVTLDRLPTLDLRIGKVFRFGRHALELDMDAFNVTNENTVFNVRTGSNRQTVRVAGTGETRVIPQFLSPNGILDPRILRFNVTYKFGAN